MAKKILYKVTAYHCPRCGASTEPTKKYCDYCGRDLEIRKKDNTNSFRLLINDGDFIFYDELLNLKIQKRIDTIDTTTLEDGFRRYVQSPLTHDFQIQLPLTTRGIELSKYHYNEVHKIRFEHLGQDKAFEADFYITSAINEIISQQELAIQTINFASVGTEVIYNTAIPLEVMQEMRCLNCGSQIKSRYGACPYCSGWSEVEW